MVYDRVNKRYICDYCGNVMHLFKDITFKSGAHLIADLIKENEK